MLGCHLLKVTRLGFRDSAVPAGLGEGERLKLIKRKARKREGGNAANLRDTEARRKAVRRMVRGKGFGSVMGRAVGP